MKAIHFFLCCRCCQQSVIRLSDRAKSFAFVQLWLSNHSCHICWIPGIDSLNLTIIICYGKFGPQLGIKRSMQCGRSIKLQTNFEIQFKYFLIYFHSSFLYKIHNKLYNVIFNICIFYCINRNVRMLSFPLLTIIIKIICHFVVISVYKMLISTCFVPVWLKKTPEAAIAGWV